MVVVRKDDDIDRNYFTLGNRTYDGHFRQLGHLGMGMGFGGQLEWEMGIWCLRDLRNIFSFSIREMIWACNDLYHEL